MNQTRYITFSVLLVLHLNCFKNVEIATRLPQLLKMALMEPGKVTPGENELEQMTSSFSSPNCLVQQVCVLGSAFCHCVYILI